MSRNFNPGDVVRFRVSPGNVFLTVVSSDGVVVIVTDGTETFPVAIGDIYRA